jgi:DNA-binding response OmpR family regulator
MRLLVVEDEVKMAGLLVRGLREDGHAVDVARTGDDALWMGQAVEYDAVVLDLMLPGLDGLEVMRRVRERPDRKSAIILLTAKGAEADRVIGLRLGADDYVVKPFSPAELVARVDAVLRRVDHVAVGAPALTFDALEIDPGARAVRRDGEPVQLTAREFDLLLFLARHPQQAFTREQLMDYVWQYAFYTDTSTVTVHIRRLRAKLEADPEHPRWIETVWGVGYRFAP